MSRAAITADWVGRVIDGRFALLEWLGGSGRRGLFRTELPQPITKKAAIKLIAAEGGDADAYLAGWAKAANLSHPHLLRVFRSGRFQIGSTELVYVVTECADEVLAQIIPERALTSEETRQMLYPMIEALGYLHQKGFVHGHVKPSNILVVDDVLKLSGDSVAGGGGVRVISQAPSIYESPEAARGTTSPSADVWALGVTLVEVLTQRPPEWERGANREPAVPATVPRPFGEIARECLRRDSEHRPTLREIKARLEPSRPIEFPSSKAGKAVVEATVPVAVPVAAESLVEGPPETDEAAPAKKRVLPLVVGLLLVVVALAVWMIRRPATQSGAVPVTGPSAVQSAAGSAAGAAVATKPGLSAKGAVTQRFAPEVASYARKTIHGTVAVAIRVTVDANGQVMNAELQSTGKSRYFSRAALEASRGWKFRAAQEDGQLVNSVWILRFKFRQSGIETAAVEEAP
jgi:TonB family protein